MVQDRCDSSRVNFAPSFDENGVPLMLNWTVDDVGRYVREELKFPQYELCFVANFIDGRKLVNVDASSLPKLGVKDFNHIQMITAKIRELLAIEEPYWNRAIRLPPHDPVPHFLERKSHSGAESDALTYEEHVRYLKHFDEHREDDHQLPY